MSSTLPIRSYTMQTLADVEALLQAATEDETTAKFQQGDVLLAAEERHIIPYGARTEHLADLAAAIGRHPRTLYRRLVAARVFPPEERRPDVPWETHARLAELVDWAEREGVTDYDPHYWLGVAAGEQDGQRKSADKIVAMIRQKYANADTGGLVYAARAEPVQVLTVRGNDIVLRFPDGLPAEIRPGMHVTITISYTTEAGEHKKGDTIRVA